MNKVIFNIFVWPLLLAISCFTALGISTTNKLKAENLALAKQIGSLEKPKQTSGVMEGVFGAKALELNPAYEGPIVIVYVSIMKVDDIVEMRGLNSGGMDGDFKYNEEDNNLYLYHNEQIHESSYLKPDYENEKYFLVSPGYANPVEMCKVSSDVALEQMMIVKNNEIESLNRSLSSANARAYEASSRYLAKVRELETAQATIQSLTNEKVELQSQVETLTTEKTTLENKIQTLNTGINEVKVMSDDLYASSQLLIETRTQINETEQQIAELEASEQTTEVETQINELKVRLTEARDAFNARFTDFSNLVMVLQNKITELEKVINGTE